MERDTITARQRVKNVGLFVAGAQVLCLLGLLLRAGPELNSIRAEASTTNQGAAGAVYFRDFNQEIPWSIHVIQISRSRSDLELQSTMGKGQWLGMATVSEQMKSIPPDWGRPIAAINGDFYHNSSINPGDPDGLQIVRGELVSAPSANRACFWVDSRGEPHRGDVLSRFQVTMPDGSSIPFGLNQERGNDAAVLYTSAIGESTRTSGGLELVLSPVLQKTKPTPTLQIGETYNLQIVELNPAGNTPLSPGRLVLSLGSKLIGTMPKMKVGDRLTLSTATTPDLAGARTALGGGPTLVAAGKARRWSPPQLRHPRTALGWNKDYYFLVEVDGRQPGLSMGMTFPELAEQMVKLGCEEAINLDGGGSATCWYLGKVVNSPSEGQERPGANSLVLIQKGKE